MSIWTLAMALVLSDGESPIKSDESVVFFPTCGHFDAEARQWVLPIHGWIFEPEADGLVRRAALSLFRRGLGLEKEAEDTAIFLDRARRFIVDNEGGKQLSVQIGQRAFVLNESGANGQFSGEVRLSSTEVEALLSAGDNRRQVKYRAVAPKNDLRVFAGTVQLLDPQGVSVISDIDDTIKISQVRDKRALLNNTFVRPFQAVPGMAGLYQSWAEQGATFHFVSSSPWQLHMPLAEFFEAEKFPAATWHMKTFRWKDSSFFELFASPEETKPRAIEPLLKQYPERRFILVGDSGEKDPEVYGTIARKYPQQVLRILIRNVTEEGPETERMRMAFAQVPTQRWQVFKEPSEALNFNLPPTR